MAQAWVTTPDPRRVEGGPNVVAVAPNGDIFAAGNVFDPLPEDSEIVVFRFDAVSGGVLWVRELDSAGADGVHGMAVDGAGDVVLCGEATLPGYGRQFLVTKLDGASGSVLWRTEFVGTRLGSGGGIANALAIDDDGNVLAAGSVTNAVTEIDDVVVKLSGADGSTLWRVERDGGSGLSEDIARVVAVDASGDVLVSARSQEVGTNVLSHVVSRLSGVDGATVWTQVLPGPVGGIEEPTAGVHDGAGRFVVAARAISRNPDNFHWLVSTLDSGSGAVLWRSAVDGRANDAGFDVPNDLAVGSTGTVFVTGSLSTSSSTLNFTVAALDGATGAEAWRRTIRGTGPSGNCEGLGIVAAANGDAIAVGRGSTKQTGFDLTATRLKHQDGKTVWERFVSGSVQDVEQGIDVALDAAGDVAISGWLNSNLAAVKLHGGNGADY